MFEMIDAVLKDWPCSSKILFASKVWWTIVMFAGDYLQLISGVPSCRRVKDKDGNRLSLNVQG